jgi:hypothetical protein
MKHRKSALLVLISMASSTLAFAQAPTRPPSETPPTSGAEPSSASSPHQRQVTEGGMTKAEHDQMMKDCVKKERQKDSSMSKEQAKKACTDQMKSQMQKQPQS